MSPNSSREWATCSASSMKKQVKLPDTMTSPRRAKHVSTTATGKRPDTTTSRESVPGSGSLFCPCDGQVSIMREISIPEGALPALPQDCEKVPSACCRWIALLVARLRLCTPIMQRSGTRSDLGIPRCGPHEKVSHRPNPHPPCSARILNSARRASAEKTPVDVDTTVHPTLLVNGSEKTLRLSLRSGFMITRNGGP